MNSGLIENAGLSGILDTQRSLVGTLYAGGTASHNDPASGLPDAQTQDYVRSVTGLGHKLDAVV